MPATLCKPGIKHGLAGYVAGGKADADGGVGLADAALAYDVAFFKMWYLGGTSYYYRVTRLPSNPLKSLVGAAGIEPATR